MKLIQNPNEYHKLQTSFLETLVSSVRTHLELAGIKGQKLKTATGNLSFELCEILDGDKALPGTDGQTPVIGFTSESTQKVWLVDSAAALHERVFGFVDAEFADANESYRELKAYLHHDVMGFLWGSESNQEDRLLEILPEILNKKQLRMLVLQLDALAKRPGKEIQKVMHARNPEFGKQRLENMRKAFSAASK